MLKKILSITNIMMGVVSIVFSSCTKDFFDMIDSENANQFEFFVIDNLKITDMPTTWQSQLDFAEQEHGTNKGPNAILLMNYQVIETIETEQQIKPLIDNIFSDEMAMTIETVDGYKLIKISDYLSFYPNLENDLFANLKISLDSLIEIGMKVVKLEWRQKNSSFNTLAIVSEMPNHVVFDNIASMIRINEQKEIMRIMMSEGISDFNKMTENNNDGSRTQIVYGADTRIDGTGQMAWSFSMRMSATFKSDGVLKETPTVSNSYNSNKPWDCKSACKYIYGVVNESTTASYIYAVGCADGGTVTITEEGSGVNTRYRISGASICKDGKSNQSYNNN